jgi:hypothetical protein
MAYDANEGPVHSTGGATERGKGAGMGVPKNMEPGGVDGFPPAIKRGYTPAKNGYDLNNGPAEMWEGEARGNGAFDFKDAGVRTGFGSSGAPEWLDGKSIDVDAINVKGSITADCRSDPMFDRFKHEETSWAIDANRTNGGTNAGDKVPSGSFPSDDGGTHSDPKFVHMPHQQTEGSGQDYTGR